MDSEVARGAWNSATVTDYATMMMMMIVIEPLQIDVIS